MASVSKGSKKRKEVRKKKSKKKKGKQGCFRENKNGDKYTPATLAATKSGYAHFVAEACSDPVVALVITV
jgi:hypothetical protein